MSDTSNLDQIEILNFLYKTSFRRPTTKDLEFRNPAEETFPFNDYSLGQEILLNRIKKFPVGNDFPTNSLLANVDDSVNINGTNFGGKLGYPETTNENSSTSFRVLNVIDSTNSQVYPNVNFILPPDFSLSSDPSNFKDGYIYSELLPDGNRLAQLAPGGFVRDIQPNIRHFHRLILSPVDNKDSLSPIDLTNLTNKLITYAFAAFDRDGNNILKNTIPPNLGGITTLSLSPLKEVEYYTIYLGTLRYSIRQFNNTNIQTTQKIVSSPSNGNWSFDFKSGLLLFNDIGSSANFDDFPPVLSFFKYIGPIGLENLINSEISLGNGGGGSGISLTDLSATNVAASGIGNLSYDSSNGKFTYTPPDLSSLNTAETMPYSANNFIVTANTTDTSISLINEIGLLSGETTFMSITVFKTNSNSSIEGGYISKYIYSFVKDEHVFTLEQEFNNNSDFRVDIDSDLGILLIQNLTNSDISFTILARSININNVCTKTALNTNSLDLIANGQNTIDFTNIIGIRSGTMVLASVKIFKTGTNSLVSGGYTIKTIHGWIKDEKIFSTDHAINNSEEFSANFDGENGIIILTNLTSNNIQLTAVIRYIDFYTNCPSISFKPREKTLLASSQITINLPFELNISSGRTVILSIIIYKKDTDPEISGGYLNKCVYSTIKNEDFFTIERELNNSLEFIANFDLDNGILNLTNLTNNDLDLNIKISSLDLF